MTPEELLQQLHDVHAPESVSFWPLAPGWWALIFVCVTVLLAIGLIWRKHRRKNAYRVAAKSELDVFYAHWQKESRDTLFLQQTNQLIRRVALRVTARNNVSSLTYKEWQEWMDAMSPSTLSEKTRLALAQSSYLLDQKESLENEVDTVYREVSTWISSHRSSKVGTR